MQATLDLGNGEIRLRDFNGKADVKDGKTETLATLLAGILTAIEREESLNRNMVKIKITASLCRHNNRTELPPPDTTGKTSNKNFAAA